MINSFDELKHLIRKRSKLIVSYSTVILKRYFFFCSNNLASTRIIYYAIQTERRPNDVTIDRNWSIYGWIYRNVRLLQQRTVPRCVRLLLGLALDLARTILFLVSVHLDPIVIRFVVLRATVTIFLFHRCRTCNMRIVKTLNFKFTRILKPNET